MGKALDSALAQALSEGEVGVQVAAYHDGQLVEESCAGVVRAGGPAVDADTIFWVASAGKPSTALVLHVMVERGLVAYDQAIASIWPEFAAHGKGSLTVGDALTHRVGLADLPHEVTPELLGDWEWMVTWLAESVPSADSESRSNYHARTWGHLVGEIAQRADPDGRSYEQLVQELVHTPLGISDLWHRVPSSVQDRVAIVKGDILSGDPVRITVTEDHDFNSADFRARLDPSGAWMTARAGARLWAAFAQHGELDGVRVLSADAVDAALEPRRGAQSAGPFAGPRAVIGQRGLWIGSEVPDCREQLGFRSPRTLWHPGAGGALGFADLDAKLSVMICHNELFDERPHPRHPFAPIVEAVYADVLG